MTTGTDTSALAVVCASKARLDLMCGSVCALKERKPLKSYSHTVCDGRWMSQCWCCTDQEYW